MRTLAAHYFISLDGVIDSPQSWHFPYATPQVQEVVAEATVGVDALLMGRRTYQEWEEFWPHQSGFPLADFINGTEKYVATTTLQSLDWEKSTILAGDVVAAVAELKQQPGQNIAINGSGTLVGTLLRAGLVDELHLLVHPVVVGTGKHLFEAGKGPLGLVLADSHTFDNGVVHHTYLPAAQAADAA